MLIFDDIDIDIPFVLSLGGYFKALMITADAVGITLIVTCLF